MTAASPGVAELASTTTGTGAARTGCDSACGLTDGGFPGAVAGGGVATALAVTAGGLGAFEGFCIDSGLGAGSGADSGTGAGADFGVDTGSATAVAGGRTASAALIASRTLGRGQCLLLTSNLSFRPDRWNRLDDTDLLRFPLTHSLFHWLARQTAIAANRSVSG